MADDGYGLGNYCTLTEFRNLFQEFKTISDTVVTLWLEMGKIKVNPCVFLRQTKLGHAYWTAHTIAASPYGRNLKLVTADGKTDYSYTFDTILLTVSPGVTVCGSSAPAWYVY